MFPCISQRIRSEKPHSTSFHPHVMPSHASHAPLHHAADVGVAFGRPPGLRVAGAASPGSRLQQVAEGLRVASDAQLRHALEATSSQGAHLDLEKAAWPAVALGLDEITSHMAYTYHI